MDAHCNGQTLEAVAAKVSDVPGPQRPDDFAVVVVRLGARVRARREKLGMTQEQLGHMVGMDRKAIQNVEYGRSSTKKDGAYGPGNPRLDTIFTIATALGVDMADLIGSEASQ